MNSEPRSKTCGQKEAWTTKRYGGRLKRRRRILNQTIREHHLNSKEEEQEGEVMGCSFPNLIFKGGESGEEEDNPTPREERRRCIECIDKCFHKCIDECTDRFKIPANEEEIFQLRAGEEESEFQFQFNHQNRRNEGNGKEDGNQNRHGTDIRGREAEVEEALSAFTSIFEEESKDFTGELRHIDSFYLRWSATETGENLGREDGYCEEERDVGIGEESDGQEEECNKNKETSVPGSTKRDTEGMQEGQFGKHCNSFNIQLGTKTWRCTTAKIERHNRVGRQDYSDSDSGKGHANDGTFHSCTQQIETNGKDHDGKAEERKEKERVHVHQLGEESLCCKRTMLNPAQEGKQEFRVEKHQEGRTNFDGNDRSNIRDNTTIFQTPDRQDVEQIPCRRSIEYASHRLYGCVDKPNATDPSGTRRYHHFRLKPPPEWELWPIHVKEVQRLNYEVADGLIAEEDKERWRKYCAHFRIMEEPHLYENVDCRKRQWRPKKCFARKQDLDMLLKFGIIERAKEEEIRCDLETFCIAETEKTRKRFITHTRMLNQCFEIEDELRFSLPGPELIKEDATFGNWACCLDFAAFFHQFEIEKRLRKYYGFRVGQKCFQLTTMPMGHRFAPGVAQILTKNVARKIEEEFGVRATCFIDNTRFVAKEKAQLRSAIKRFYEITRRANMTLNETEEEALAGIAVSYTFLGMCFDHKKQEVSLAEKSKKKITEAIRILMQDPTMEECNSIFSLFVWGSHVVQLPLHDYFYIFKFIRRRASWNVKEKARVWQCVKEIWREWADRLIEARAEYGKRQTEDYIYTDASMKGWGAIGILGEKIHVVAGRWSSRIFRFKPSIAELEGRALLLALHKLDLAQRKIHVRVDNTTVQRTVENTRSRSYIMNQIADKVSAVTREKGASIISISYVNTKVNPSDWWSRLWTTAN